MSRLRIDDGYTLTGETAETYVERGRVYSGLPVVKFEYRPAMPDAIFKWQFDNVNAVSGADQLKATAELVADHLTGWDVAAGTETAKINAENVRRLPYPILQQIVATVTTWAPRQQATAAGNSVPASA